MNVVLLDCADAGDARTRSAAEALVASFAARGAEADRIVVRDLDVRACTGCFGCWTRTPGECVIADDARSVAERVIAADAFAVVTPIAFGSYGSRAKSVLDRLICLVLPQFTMIGGEVHHRRRYERYPHMLALGTLGELPPSMAAEQAALFARLVERNAVNLHNQSHAVEVVVGDAAARDATERLVEGLLGVDDDGWDSGMRGDGSFGDVSGTEVAA